MRVLNTYQFNYVKADVTQIKHQVSRQDWEEIIKPMRLIISNFKSWNKGKDNLQTIDLKKILNEQFINHEDCFPVGCPLDKAITSGFLELPPAQGGKHQVIVKRIKK